MTTKPPTRIRAEERRPAGEKDTTGTRGEGVREQDGELPEGR